MKLNEDKIRALIYHNELTQTDLADKAGLARATISAVCNGKSCSYMSARKIAAALGVMLEDIKR